jgi:hypothetical protein
MFITGVNLPLYEIWQSYMYALDIPIGKQNVLASEIDLKNH